MTMMNVVLLCAAAALATCTAANCQFAPLRTEALSDRGVITAAAVDANWWQLIVSIDGDVIRSAAVPNAPRSLVEQVTLGEAGDQRVIDGTGDAVRFASVTAMACYSSDSDVNRRFVYVMDGRQLRRVMLQSRVVSTLAGSGDRGTVNGVSGWRSSFEDGPTFLAIAVRGGGRVVISQSAAGCVREYDDVVNAVTTVLGVCGSSFRPTAVAVDLQAATFSAAGSGATMQPFYIADAASGSVLHYNGTQVVYATAFGSALRNPVAALALSASVPESLVAVLVGEPCRLFAKSGTDALSAVGIPFRGTQCRGDPRGVSSFAAARGSTAFLIMQGNGAASTALLFQTESCDFSEPSTPTTAVPSTAGARNSAAPTAGPTGVSAVPSTVPRAATASGDETGPTVTVVVVAVVLVLLIVCGGTAMFAINRTCTRRHARSAYRRTDGVETVVAAVTTSDDDMELHRTGVSETPVNGTTAGSGGDGHDEADTLVIVPAADKRECCE
jgi:hypothetical protein